MENRQLYHHGIKGMKWGVRRFQKKNGTLTSEGKRRARREMSDDAKAASALKKKKVSELSNAELKKLNERTRLEQEHSRLHPNAAKKGWRYVAAAAGIMGTAIAVYNNSNQVIKIGQTVGSKIVDIAGDMVMSDLSRHIG